jgi:hypothetical protein
VTKPLPFTQAILSRAIKAAQKAGLRVTGIRPDGTLLVQNADQPLEPLRDPTADPPSKWDDVET